jgi:hypothetical protein
VLVLYKSAPLLLLGVAEGVLVLECTDGVMLEVGDTDGVLDMETGEADTDGGSELEEDADAEWADGITEAVVEIDGVLLALLLRVAVTVGVGATLLVGVYVVCGDAPGTAVGVVMLV